MGNLRLDWLKFIFQALDEIKLNNQKNKRRQNRKKVSGRISDTNRDQLSGPESFLEVISFYKYSGRKWRFPGVKFN